MFNYQDIELINIFFGYSRPPIARLYSVSKLWYPSISCGACMFFGLLGSLITGNSDDDYILTIPYPKLLLLNHNKIHISVMVHSMRVNVDVFNHDCLTNKLLRIGINPSPFEHQAVMQASLYIVNIL